MPDQTTQIIRTFRVDKEYYDRYAHYVTREHAIVRIGNRIIHFHGSQFTIGTQRKNIQSAS